MDLLHLDGEPESVVDNVDDDTEVCLVVGDESLSKKKEGV
jgi:hypothetical protein